MDAELTPLSCPGRVQDWLGAAVDQIETLLQIPLPSLSGSDQAIGALRIKHKRPSQTTVPYTSQPTNLISGTFPVAYQVPPSVSSNWLLREEKSPSRCENCVAEKGSRCSRDLPSCTRCHKNGWLCFYVEGAPAGRRKPQGRPCVRSWIREGEHGPPLESLSIVPASEDPALPEADEVLATLYPSPDIYPLHAISEYARSSLEKCPTSSSVGCPTGILSGRNLKNSQFTPVVTKRQVTMLPATPTFSTLPCRTSKLETTREIARVELQSQWPVAVANGLNPHLMRGAALAVAARSFCQDPYSEEGRKAVENVLRKCADNEIQKHAAHLAVLPLQSQIPFHRQTSTPSSTTTTPPASTLVSRSTSRSSGEDSLPITPAAELPTPPDGTNVQLAGDTSISASQISSYKASFALHEAPATDDMEARLLHMEQLVDLYLLSHYRHQAACGVTSGVDPQDMSLSDGFVEELFEEGDAAKRLVEFQQRSPKKRKVPLGP